MLLGSVSSAVWVSEVAATLISSTAFFPSASAFLARFTSSVAASFVIVAVVTPVVLSVLVAAVDDKFTVLPVVVVATS
ncbi:hypothetical protein D3C76_1078580 [compost metagenome]